MHLEVKISMETAMVETAQRRRPDVWNILLPKNPNPSKVANLRTRTPATQVQTLPLEGPRILRAGQMISATSLTSFISPQKVAKVSGNPLISGKSTVGW